MGLFQVRSDIDQILCDLMSQRLAYTGWSLVAMDTRLGCARHLKQVSLKGYPYFSLLDQTTKLVHLMLGTVDLVKKTHGVVLVEVNVGLVKQLFVAEQDGVFKSVAK